MSNTSSPGQITAVRCDLRQESDTSAMFQLIRDKYGRLDVCVNNAGLSYASPLLTGQTDKWREMFEVSRPTSFTEPALFTTDFNILHIKYRGDI